MTRAEDAIIFTVYFLLSGVAQIIWANAQFRPPFDTIKSIVESRYNGSQGTNHYKRILIVAIKRNKEKFS